MILNTILFFALRCILAVAALLGCALAANAAQAAAPASAEITYNLFRNKILLGTITEHFEAKDGAYRVTSDGRASGLLALVQRDPIRLVSSGDLTKDGLRPQRFEGHRSGKSMFAEFDWPGAKLNLIRGDGQNQSLALPPGTQDRLSIMYQLMFAIPNNKAPVLHISMTNGRKIEKYRYTSRPDVTLDTPFKRLNTIHLVKQREADDSVTEIWVAPEYGNLPVRLIIIEDDGVRYEQIVTKLDITR